MKNKDLAKGLTLSPSAVTRLVQRGMPTDSVGAARKWRTKHLQAASVKGARIDTARGRDPHSAAYRKARTNREQLRLQREQLELGRLRGKLIDVDQAARVNATAFRIVRDSLENIPQRIADSLASETDAGQVRRILEDEIRTALGAAVIALAGADVARHLDDEERDAEAEDDEE